MIQIKSESQFEFVPRDTEESEFPDLVDFGGEALSGEVGGWGRDPFSRNFMKPTPCRKWYLTTGRRFH